MLAKLLQSCLTLCDPMEAAHQAPLSTGFSRQEYWSGLPFPSPSQIYGAVLKQRGLGWWAKGFKYVQGQWIYGEHHE